MISFGRPAVDKERLAAIHRVKAWARDTLESADPVRFSEDVMELMVSEVKCLEEGCPPLETVVCLLLENEPSTKMTIRQPVVDVQRGHVMTCVRRLLAGEVDVCSCGDALFADVLAARRKSVLADDDAAADLAAVERARAKPAAETTREDVDLIMRSAIASDFC
jgi:hypothetical protein